VEHRTKSNSDENSPSKEQSKNSSQVDVQYETPLDDSNRAFKDKAESLNFNVSETNQDPKNLNGLKKSEFYPTKRSFSQIKSKQSTPSSKLDESSNIRKNTNQFSEIVTGKDSEKNLSKS
jgi:hypothetical protein